MRKIKILAFILLTIMLLSANANAWGRKEQSILIGAGIALLLPAIINSGKATAQPQMQHTESQKTKYIKPQVEYIYIPNHQKPQIHHKSPNLSHRYEKPHNYVNKNDDEGKIIIERSDGSITIIKEK